LHRSSFIFELIKLAPERVEAGIPMQPIGHDSSNDGTFGPDMWRPWGQHLIDKGASFSIEDVDAFGHALFDPGFVFTATRDELKSFQTPLLLMYGNDRAHPRGVSEEVGTLLPNVEIIAEWKEEAVVPRVVEQMRAFLRAHRLVSAR